MNRKTAIIGLIVLCTTFVLTGILSSVIMAGGPTADFGDAPDASNSLNTLMYAYPGVLARFPTALERSAPPYGPQHENAPAFFVLGTAYSGEDGAESGADTDIDGTNNIQPAINVADSDGLDDGLVLPDTFEHCQPVTLTYEVTVLNTYGGPMYANLWADWNHDGSWVGEPPGICPGDNTAEEWVMQNNALNLSSPGTYVFSISFTPWYPDLNAATWLRLSVSEQMAGEDGAGPQNGYQYGETEDYKVPGTPYLAYLPAVHGSGPTPPPPGDPDTHEDPEDPPDVALAWPQLPPGEGTASVPADELSLQLSNIGDSGMVRIDLTYMVNGTKTYTSIGPVPIQSGSYITDVIVYEPPSINVNSPGTILAEVYVTQDGGNQGGDPAPNGPFANSVEQLYFHDDTSQPGNIVIYQDESYHAQIQAESFDRNPNLWNRLSLGFPGPVHPGLSQVTTYIHGDPVLMEGEPDEGHGDWFQDDGIQPSESGGSFTLCLEWYTAPSDNGFGEDKGVNDDGWRARGAYVRVYYSGGLVFNNYLNTAGCALIQMNASSGGLAHIEFDGYARLASGGAYNYLHRAWAWDPDDEPIHWTAAVQISGVQSGATYRPEINGNDAFSILSYGAQERFNGGENGNTLYLVKANCNLDPSKSSCSTIYDGRHTIFVKDTQWKKKFLVIHEWGHKILTWTASYVNDCSLGSSSHAMESLEYSSCAAMEGWAHFVAVDVWNNHTGISNPGAKFVYWNGNVYDAELQYQACYDGYGPLFIFVCDDLGLEKDWMRFWWDFHTNSTPGTPPSHSSMFGIIDDVTWQSGSFHASEAFLDVLNGTLNTRWDNYGCWNGIGYNHC